MTRIASRPKLGAPAWHEGFLALLPKICQYARFAFRGLDPESKQEGVQCVVASALAAYVRLVQLGKADIIYATPLAMYAIRQYRDGCRVGAKLNVQDVSSGYCQRVKGVVMERLDHFDEEENQWAEAIVEDKTAGPAEIARTRIDFSNWLASLKRRDRRVAESLALGNGTFDVAKRFKVSAGRVSQLRRELAESWRAFVGDEPDAATVAA